MPFSSNPIVFSLGVNQRASIALCRYGVLGPLFAIQKLLNFDYSFVSEDNDVENFEKWCAERFPNNSLELRVGLWIQAEDSVQEDLAKPGFRKKLWDAAREFEASVFNKEN